MGNMRGAKAILAVSALFFATVLFGQKVEREGKMWLDANKDQAEVNVAGAWQSKQWGRVILIQAEGSREVSGRGDGWDISGVVSGKKVFLLFSHKGRIAYSAEILSDGANALTGNYTKGLFSSSSKMRPMQLSK